MNLEIHRLPRDIHFMLVKLSHATWYAQLEVIAVCCFAVVFLVVGILRIVEFKGLGLPGPRQKILVALHILGCIMLSIMMVLLAIDIDKIQARLVAGLLVSALLLLF